jgi:hypothetical protein
MLSISVKIIINSIPKTPEVEDGVIPCPRVNCFKHPNIPVNLNKKGEYYFNYEARNKKGERCGIDIFSWLNNDVQIISNPRLPVEQQPVGENLDQIKRTINFTKDGHYTFFIDII